MTPATRHISKVALQHFKIFSKNWSLTIYSNSLTDWLRASVNNVLARMACIHRCSIYHNKTQFLLGFTIYCICACDDLTKLMIDKPSFGSKAFLGQETLNGRWCADENKTSLKLIICKINNHNIFLIVSGPHKASINAWTQGYKT